MGSRLPGERSCPHAQPGRCLLYTSNLHAALHGGEAAQGRTGSRKLALVFLVSTFENADQRTGAELIGNGGEILEALGFAKGPQKAAALHSGAPEQAPLGQDDRPGDQAEDHQCNQDELGDRTRAGNEFENFAADEEGRVWEQLHRG